MINRYLSKQIGEIQQSGKAIIVLGARQVGKTTLLESMFPDALWLNGDDADTREKLAQANPDRIRAEIGSKKILVIDEAQRIENIGLVAKIITDRLKDITLVLSGSSSFELANKVNEPLTGRKWEFFLYPFSVNELIAAHGRQKEERLLEQRMIYGLYPEIVMAEGRQQDLLKQLASSYLFKDILTWENIKKPDKLERLLQAIAFQTGQMVSYHELGQMSGLNTATVERYINLLEQAFIIYRLGSFSRNLRNELNKSRKIYFYDNGLRNAVANQFQPLALRNDIGGLWENFLLAERTKYLAEKGIYCNRFFWRTKDGSEIDYIEERDGQLFAYEFKWNPDARVRVSSSFQKHYKPVEIKVIHRDNWKDWLVEM